RLDPRPRGRGAAPRHRRDLRGGVDPGVPPDARALRPAPPRRLPGRAGGRSYRSRLAARRPRGPPPPGAHGAAPLAHAGGAAAPPAGGAGRAAAPRAAAPAPAPGGRGPRRRTDPPPGGDHRAPGGGLARLRARVLDVARAGALRAGPSLGCVAPPGARLLLRHRAPLLAAGDPTLAQPDRVARVGDDPLPGAGRGPERRAGGDPHLRRPRDLPDLRGRAAPLGHRGPRGPVARRRHHVGPRVPRLPAAGDLARRPDAYARARPTAREGLPAREGLVLGARKGLESRHRIGCRAGTIPGGRA